VECFRAAGTKVAFDPNMRFRLWSPNEARKVFLELARKCDILILSLAEAEIMTGLKGGESTLDARLSLGPPQIVLKAGDKGAWYGDGAERGFCPCHPVSEIDPVGAGDAFCTGLLSGLLDGQPLRRRLNERPPGHLLRFDLRRLPGPAGPPWALGLYGRAVGSRSIDGRPGG
jgi:2-dehydro-3-deoxygluconokinase